MSKSACGGVITSDKVVVVGEVTTPGSSLEICRSCPPLTVAVIVEPWFVPLVERMVDTATSAVKDGAQIGRAHV